MIDRLSHWKAVELRRINVRAGKEFTIYLLDKSEEV